MRFPRWLQRRPKYDLESIEVTPISKELVPVHTTNPDRPTNIATHINSIFTSITESLEGTTTMSALNNRQLALKLAVEANNAAATGDDEYALVDSSGAVDNDLLNGALELADRLAAWLGADVAETTSDTAASPAPAAAPERTADDAIADITEKVNGLADDFGRGQVRTALGYLPQARGHNYASTLRVARDGVSSYRNELGSRFADAITEAISTL